MRSADDSVSLPGFRTEQRKGFRIGTQQSAVLDFMLEIGGITEQVIVAGEAPLVERASATQATSAAGALVEVEVQAARSK